ncbi:MOB kinase activator-like 1-like protein [Smittium mucronatum]|uniref:MOB kinase activator-like 1-like protein n=1 Tax=Smittium mucronatum TaxID=133383 RepID=A0A1R0GWG6_9FUNG|nr:MOB kinase activator-like 1-like protein [Smittium mucronatum]
MSDEAHTDPDVAAGDSDSALGSSRFNLKMLAERTLGGDALKKAVALPQGENVNEWIASHGKNPPTFHPPLLFSSF